MRDERENREATSPKLDGRQAGTGRDTVVAVEGPRRAARRRALRMRYPCTPSSDPLREALYSFFTGEETESQRGRVWLRRRTRTALLSVEHSAVGYSCCLPNGHPPLSLLPELEFGDAVCA